MTEVACAVCGAVYRFAPADIPAGGKTLTCAKCKARIAVPGATAGTAGDKIDLADLPAPVRRLQAPPKPGAGSIEMPRVGTGSLSTADLGLDLPAPKSPLPRTATTDALTLDSIDLVAPVRPSGPSSGPPAVGAPIDLPRSFEDLPAPRSPAAASAIDLPAPKRASGAPPPPAPSRSAIDLPDLPAPKRGATPAAAPSPPPAQPSSPIDLPAPKRASSGRALPDLPAPKRAAAPALPAIAKPTTPTLDLPAPRAPAPATAPDLLTPKRPSDLPDLPAPKRASSARPGDLFDDLPAPVTPQLSDILLTPKSASDLPAPKGFFDDLPQPKGPSGHDLPAPKGFFDDLPQSKGPGASASPDLPAPKGYFQDLPQPKGPSGPDLPAPKGYFQDLPQSKGPSGSGSDLPAPKGFFEGLPQPKGPSGPDLPAPKGFFDDLPQPHRGSSQELAPVRPGPIDLDGLDLAPPSGTSGPIPLEPAIASARPAIPGGPRPASASVPPLLELGDTDALAGLDLPSPQTSRPSGVVSFKPSQGGAHDAARPIAADPALEVVSTPRQREVARSQKIVKPVEPKTEMSPRTKRVLVLALLLVAGLGGGSFWYYRRYQAKKQRTADIEQKLNTARQAMIVGDRGHWQRALNAARGVLALEKKHPEASGLAAEALIASALDDGIDRLARIKQAQPLIEAARARHTPAFERAGGLDSIADGDAEAAIKRLQPLVNRKDADALLFLGWAQLDGGHWDDAIATFDRSIKETPRRTVPALYGKARAQLAKGDRDGAHQTFLAVIAADKDHVGALVGDAEAMSSADFVERESTLLSILQRKDIDKADPRAVARAWTLAGDDAARAGRIDAARDRYRKSLALAADSVTTLVSSADLELRDGKLDAAVAVSEKALGLDASDPGANLVAAEIDIRRGHLTEAAQRLAMLHKRTPPLAGAALGRLSLLDGMRLEAGNETDAALAAYDAAAAALGPTEVAPAIAAATLLGKQADLADAAKKPDEAKALRDRADQKLSKLVAAAETDAGLAVTLGVAYLSAGSPAESERWLRKALERRPTDVEAHFQLAEALRRQGKRDDAVTIMMKAFDLDPTRVDVGVELARGFEANHRDRDAAALYKRLLSAKDIQLDVRVRAGRFFARTGDIDGAAAQGEAILKVDPQNAAGLYLRGEGELAAGHTEAARHSFTTASEHDPDAQYLDGLGRACEAHAAATGDTQVRDEALRAYIEASQKDPTMLGPLLGRGRLHVARSEYSKALAAYQAALTLAPQNPDIFYGVGVSYAHLGDKPHAIEWLSKAIAVAEYRAEVYFQLGNLYYETDRAGPAAAALTKATDMGLKDERNLGKTVPWLTDAYWLLGTVEQVLGHDAATRRAWESYLARDPTNQVQADEVRRIMLGLRH